MTYSEKPLFNLSLIVKETGVKADTIRAWERRYGLPQPARSNGGQRLYSEYDLQIILWLKGRKDEGMRISQAVAYWHELNNEGIDPLESEPEINPPVILDSALGANDNLEQLQKQWLKFCFNFDEINAVQVLSQAFAQYPASAVFGELILPGLRKVGELWKEGRISVQQEHFTSEIAVREIQSLISSAPSPVHKQRILLSNPPGENHVIGLLMMALLLKNRGWPIIYLGADVPLDDLLKTANDSHIDLAIMNSSRLNTSVALLEAIQLLAANKIPTAFSGWIFNKSEGLEKKFPGLYLGNDICESINKVEEFLNNPVPLPAVEELDDSRAQLIKKIQKSTPLINNKVLEKLESKGLEFSQKDIIRANYDLAADLTASLRLGSNDQINPNLNWLSKILVSRDISEHEFRNYLTVFTEALEEVLGNDAKEILPLIKIS